MKRRAWDANDLAWMLALFPDIPTKDVAAALDRTPNSVSGMAFLLRLRKSDVFWAAERVIQIERAHTNPNVISGRFAKGSVPANKGLRRPGWAPGRMRETQFKKGILPASSHPDFYVLGALRINTDGYIDIRTSFEPGATGWTGLHRYIWMQEHGPIPKGYVVTFKDGDRNNVIPENLALISMADNARRNYIDKYPIEVRRLVTMKGHITRHVRRIQREAMTA